jgi:hypothetical protein
MTEETMFTTIGDVVLIFGILLATSISIWATMVVATLLYPVRAAKVARSLETSPWKVIGRGTVITIPSILAILVLANIPNPIVKFLALVFAFIFLGMGALGASGLVRWVSERVHETGSGLSVYGSITRAAALIVGAANIPFFGWFFIAPLALLASIGALSSGFFGRSTPSAPFAGETQP